MGKQRQGPNIWPSPDFSDRTRWTHWRGDFTAAQERAAIVAWLRQCGSDHEQDGRLSRVALGKTFAKVADAIERGEHLDLARGE